MDSVSAVLSRRKDFVVKEIPIEDIGNNAQDLQKIDILWYHRPDSSTIDQQELNIGLPIKKFVKGGGKLLLTLDAVKLLNSWDIEPEKLQSATNKVVDEGFGRKLGFHGYRKHPVFTKLHGGAYTWHAKNDHDERKVGFLGEDHWPQAKGSKIIGIDWSYITYHENNKLLWQTPLGEGTILAAGAYLHYDRPNFNKAHLEQFTRNVIRYLDGQFAGDEAFYWQNDPNKVIAKRRELSKVILSSPHTWKVPTSSLEMKRNKAADNYWDVSGRRILIMGNENGGINEIWTQPIMALRDFVPGVRSQSGDVVWLNKLSPTVTNRPDVLMREYNESSWKLKEIITASRNDPTAVIHYEWQGPESSQLVFKMKSNLRQMWPYSSKAMGSLYYSWSDELNGLQVYDRSGDFNMLLGFNADPRVKKIGHFNDSQGDGSAINTTTTDKKQVAGYFAFDLNGNDQLDVILSAGNEGKSSALEDYKKAIKNPGNLLDKTTEYYKSFFDSVLTIETSDTTFNNGYKWALAGTDQFVAKTPGLGTSLMAGYNTTKAGWGGGQTISGRPGYAWYFGRDAVWSGFALDAYGDTKDVKEILRTFGKYQDVTGKIYHELTTSGSVHYDAADATPLYILLAGHYLRYSGDTKFIKSQWPKIKKAIAFCYQTDTDGDGLIENTNVGHGWVEGGELFGAHTTFYLAGLWAKALMEAAYLANELEHKDLANQYMNDANKVKDKVNGEFWDNDNSFFYYGKMKDGSFNDQKTVLPAVPVYLGIVDKEKAEKVTTAYGTDNFSADWGVRIIGQDNPLYSPAGYHYGSVWPLFTGWTSLAEYETGRINQGFTHMMNNLMIYKNWDQGSIEEVMHGELYQPSGVSHHQCWSETMVLQPALEGMLGLAPDAVNDHLSFSPSLPWHWKYADIKNIRVGSHRIGFHMKRTENKTEFIFKNDANKPLDVTFRPAFPLGTKFSSIRINGKETESYKVQAKDDESTRLELPNLEVTDSLLIIVKHTDGIGTIPNYVMPEIGSKSENFRILSEKLNGDSFKVEVEGESGRVEQFKMFNVYDNISADNASISDEGNNIYLLTVNLPESQSEYVRKDIKIKVKDNPEERAAKN